MKTKISIIVPLYNKEADIPILYNKLYEVIHSLSHTYDHEIIFINDGSSDNSWFLIAQLASQNEHIKAVNFSRKFGHQMALKAGYDLASGDAIISLNEDLQDPLMLILEMLEQWKSGSAIVYARRINHKKTFLRKFTTKLYSKLLNSVSKVPLSRNSNDFKLIDTKVLTALKNCKEETQYLHNMVAWTKFKYSFVDFNHPNKNSHKTKYSWTKIIKHAFDELAESSLFFLKFAPFAGIFVITTGSLIFIYIALNASFFGIDYPIFKLLGTMLYIFMGIQCILLWLIGEYISRIYEQQENKPLYSIEEIVIHEKTTDIPKATAVQNDIFEPSS